MDFIHINPKDNVAVALHPLTKGIAIEIDEIRLNLQEDIPAGHKFALLDMESGTDVIKYGFPIGHVTQAVKKGSLIDHTKISTNLSGLLEYSYTPRLTDIAPVALGQISTFKGFRRASGEVGVRNQIWIIPTVGCVNGTVQKLASLFTQEKAGCMGNVDAIVAFPHNYGCSQLGEDHENTRKVLKDMVCHPNAGGVLMVGLGCENNQLAAFQSLLGDFDSNRIKFMETQRVVGDELEYGLQLLRDLFDACSRDERTDVPVSELKIGLKCGGSDGLSGITANPLLGVFSDWIVSQGGTTVLTEVPEMFGAETILMNRCQDEDLFNRTVHLINDFKSYFMSLGQPVYENPSPGNKAGGISTLEEKSLGCTQKCGTSTVRGVLRYGDRLSARGLNLLSAPGNDLVASTALAAAGCQIVLFTTGRGTPFGTFVPTLKVSTNTPLALAKPAWIDFNAGVLADGTPRGSVNESSGTAPSGAAISNTLPSGAAPSMPMLSGSFIETVLAVASGAAVCHEKAGFREIAIFKTGVTL